MSVMLATHILQATGGDPLAKFTGEMPESKVKGNLWCNNATVSEWAVFYVPTNTV